MAGIDKTYVTKEEYQLARAWWLDNFDKQKAELGFVQWLYPLDYAYSDVESDVVLTKEFLNSHTADIDIFDDIKGEDKELCLWNTGRIFDMWLAKNCPLDFIQARLRSQYNENDWMLKYAPKMDFTERPALFYIEKDKSCVYFYEDVENEYDTPVLLEKMIVYGTTYFFKLLDEAKNAFKSWGTKDETLRMKMRYFGIDVVYENLKFYAIGLDDEHLDEIHPDFSEKLFRSPEFIYSFDLKDSEGCIPEQIILSHEDQAFDAKQYKDAEMKYMKRYLLFLPEYMRDRIKK